jgi:hypothetical protein
MKKKTANNGRIVTASLDIVSNACGAIARTTVAINALSYFFLG